MKQQNLIRAGLLILATMGLSVAAQANTVLGAAVGAAVGSAIGQQNGRNGAIIGGAIGGAVGAEMGREAEGDYDRPAPPPPVYEVRHEAYYQPRTIIIERPYDVYYRPYWRRPHWNYGYYRHYDNYRRH